MQNVGPKSRTPLLWSGVVALVISFATVYLVHYYGETRPIVAGAGRMHAATIHSRTVYLTNGEYALAFISHVIAVVVIGIFVGVLLRALQRKVSKP
jgi:hypothetical protein